MGTTWPTKRTGHHDMDHGEAYTAAPVTHRWCAWCNSERWDDAGRCYWCETPWTATGVRSSPPLVRDVPLLALDAAKQTAREVVDMLRRPAARLRAEAPAYLWPVGAVLIARGLWRAMAADTRRR